MEQAQRDPESDNIHESILDKMRLRLYGHPLTVTQQIWIGFILPSAFSTMLFIASFAIDAGVTYQLVRDQHSILAAVTLLFVYAPAVPCLILTLSKPPSMDDTCDAIWWSVIQVFHFIFFPIGVMHRYATRLFWSISAVRDVDPEREEALRNASDPHQTELFFLMDAVFHAAPQALFQACILLAPEIITTDETDMTQKMSVIFSITTLSKAAALYQRYESQKVVGRLVPWTLRREPCNAIALVNVTKFDPAALMKMKTSQKKETQALPFQGTTSISDLQNCSALEQIITPKDDTHQANQTVLQADIASSGMHTQEQHNIENSVTEGGEPGENTALLPQQNTALEAQSSSGKELASRQKETSILKRLWWWSQARRTPSTGTPSLYIPVDPPSTSTTVMSTDSPLTPTPSPTNPIDTHSPSTSSPIIIPTSVTPSTSTETPAILSVENTSLTPVKSESIETPPTPTPLTPIDTHSPSTSSPINILPSVTPSTSTETPAILSVENTPLIPAKSKSIETPSIPPPDTPPTITSPTHTPARASPINALPSVAPSTSIETPAMSSPVYSPILLTSTSQEIPSTPIPTLTDTSSLIHSPHTTAHSTSTKINALPNLMPTHSSATPSAFKDSPLIPPPAHTLPMTKPPPPTEPRSTTSSMHSPFAATEVYAFPSLTQTTSTAAPSTSTEIYLLPTPVKAPPNATPPTEIYLLPTPVNAPTATPPTLTDALSLSSPAHSPPIPSTQIKLPQRKPRTEGLTEDEPLGMVVAMFGWWCFLIARVLAIAAFSHFYMWASLGVVFAHQASIIAYLCVCKPGFNIFALALSKIFILCPVEINIRYKYPRIFLLAFVIITTLEDISTMLIWYFRAKWESWWYDYTCYIIIGGHGMAFIHAALYFFLFDPKPKYTD